MNEKLAARPRPIARRWRFSPWLAFAGISLWGAAAFAAPGDISRRFPINEENPSANIPSPEERDKSPLEFGYYLQDLFTKGELAYEKKDWEQSIKYFEALAKIATDRAFPFSRLCQAYQGVGKLDVAAANCQKALGLAGASLFDHVRFVNLTLSKKTLAKADVESLDASLAHVRSHLKSLPAAETPAPLAGPEKPKSQKPTPEEIIRNLSAFKEAQKQREQALAGIRQRAEFEFDFELLACRVAVRVRDTQRLSACLGELSRLKAGEQARLPFEWTKAVIENDQARATALVARAKLLGIPEVTLLAMRTEQEKAFAATGVTGFFKRWGLGLALVLLGGVAAFGVARRLRNSNFGIRSSASR